MTINDILNDALDKKITYGEAISKLKELKLPEDKFEELEIIFHKILGKDKELDHSRPIIINGIPNEIYFPILQETIKLVRVGLFSPDICQHLYDTWGIGGPLINYFINEAISIVRMNTLKPEEIAAIGKAYHKVAIALQQQGQDVDPEIEGTEEINAEQVSDIIVNDDNY